MCCVFIWNKSELVFVENIKLSSHWPVLKIGITFAILCFDGTTPVTSDVLMM